MYLTVRKEKESRWSLLAAILCRHFWRKFWLRPWKLNLQLDGLRILMSIKNFSTVPWNVHIYLRKPFITPWLWVWIKTSFLANCQFTISLFYWQTPSLDQIIWTESLTSKDTNGFSFQGEVIGVLRGVLAWFLLFACVCCSFGAIEALIPHAILTAISCGDVSMGGKRKLRFAFRCRSKDSRYRHAEWFVYCVASCCKQTVRPLWWWEYQSDNRQQVNLVLTWVYL